MAASAGPRQLDEQVYHCRHNDDIVAAELGTSLERKQHNLLARTFCAVGMDRGY
jgi:hypothetical protein